jgi:hypothetical protein
MAPAMATPVAAIAVAATMAAIPIATAMATIAMARTLAAIAAVATARSGHPTKDEGRSLLLAAHQGDPDQGEEHRQPEHNNAVHPRILQNYLQVP